MKTQILTALLLIFNISAARAISTSSSPQFAQARRITQQVKYQDSIAISDEERKKGDVYYNWGVEKYNAGNKQGAILDFNIAILINSSDAAAYNNRGLAKYDLGDNKGALLDLERAIAINSNLYQAYVNRGNIKSDLGDNRGAILDFDLSISIAVDYAEAYNNRGLAKSALGNKQGAILDLTTAALLFRKQGQTAFFLSAMSSIQKIRDR